MRIGSFILVTGLAVCQVGTAGAQVVGSGQLKGQLAFSVKHCGADRGRAEVIFTVAPDGTWTAGSGEGLALSGTSQPIGNSGRKLALQFDAASGADFVVDRGDDVEALCEVTGVVVESATPKRFTLVLNHKRTRATLLVIYRLTGRAGSGVGQATFRLRAAGRWTPS